MLARSSVSQMSSPPRPSTRLTNSLIVHSSGSVHVPNALISDFAALDVVVWLASGPRGPLHDELHHHSPDSPGHSTGCQPADAQHAANRAGYRRLRHPPKNCHSVVDRGAPERALCTRWVTGTSEQRTGSSDRRRLVAVKTVHTLDMVEHRVVNGLCRRCGSEGTHRSNV